MEKYANKRPSTHYMYTCYSWKQETFARPVISTDTSKTSIKKSICRIISRQKVRGLYFLQKKNFSWFWSGNRQTDQLKETATFQFPLLRERIDKSNLPWHFKVKPGPNKVGGKKKVNSSLNSRLSQRASLFKPECDDTPARPFHNFRALSSVDWLVHTT